MSESKKKTKTIQKETTQKEVLKIKEEKTEHKKHVTNEPKNSNKTKLIIASLIVILLIVIVFFFLNQYKYSFVIDNVKYVSNEYTPTEFFNELKINQTIYVSPVMKENGADPVVFNALNLWQISLIGNGITVIQLIRTTSENGTVLYCYTNDGNVYISKQIPVQECNAIINDSNKFVILMEKGNEKTALLSKNKLTVYSPLDSINVTNFSVIKQIFPNAEELVKQFNEAVYGIQ